MAAANIPNSHESRQLQLAMWVSLAVGFLMLGAKIIAYWMTGSAAILSDAAESVVHVVAVSFAAYSLWLSRKPPDPSHLYPRSMNVECPVNYISFMLAFARKSSELAGSSKRRPPLI